MTAREFGCWGDHFEVAKADAAYCAANAPSSTSTA